MIDTNVLVDAHLRDVFLQLAVGGAIRVLWSQEILGELERTLIAKLDLPEQRVRTLIETIARVFALDEVVLSPSNTPIGPATPDPGDQHVLDAAILGEADVIISFDRRGFPSDDEMYQLDIEVLRPDQGLLLLLNESGTTALIAALDEIRDRSTRPPVTRAEQLTRLARDCPETTARLRASERSGPEATEIPTVTDLMTSSSDRLNELAALEQESTEANRRYASVLTRQTQHIVSGNKSGDRGRRDRAIRSARRAIASAQRELHLAKRDHATLRSTLWNEARQQTIMWIEHLVFDDARAVWARDIEEAWGRGAETARASQAINARLLDQLTNEEVPGLTATERSCRDELCREIEREIAWTAKYIDDIAFMRQQIGEKLHGQDPEQ